MSSQAEGFRPFVSHHLVLPVLAIWQICPFIYLALTKGLVTLDSATIWVKYLKKLVPQKIISGDGDEYVQKEKDVHTAVRQMSLAGKIYLSQTLLLHLWAGLKLTFIHPSYFLPLQRKLYTFTFFLCCMPVFLMLSASSKNEWMDSHENVVGDPDWNRIQELFLTLGAFESLTLMFLPETSGTLKEY